MTASPPRECPCHSSLRYAACCAPYHRGDREPPSCEALMRSRYSAFALGLGDYLVRTLAAEHPDAALPPGPLARELGRARERQRFQGLTIVASRAGAGEGEVLFVARIFERGADRSFAELSRFVREDGGWRYASGDAVPGSRLPADLSRLDREGFLALAGPARGR